MTKLAVIRIRGPVKVVKKVEATLQMLKLKKVNNCRIIENTPSNLGMINKVKEYVTWGELNEETEKKLQQKIKNNIIRLHPPRKGFEKKGIKTTFNKGGVLGNRKEKINELIKKMMV